MSNILDYVKWRGDLSFQASPFNEVDNLIISMLSYIHFDGVVEPNFNNPMKLSKVASLIFEKKEKVVSLLAMREENFEELLRLTGESRRFGSIKLMNHINKIDLNITMQFSATVFEISRNVIYISFRGTDDTVVGWQEDFNMAVMDTVPSQKQALKYMIHCSNVFGDCMIYVGGHSKGGNLAVYSALKSPKAICNRIIHVYNNDGPGFMNSNINPKLYDKMQNRITTLVPQSSIIGMLLDHEEDYTVVKSSGTGGIMQHNAFNWEVLGREFIHLQDVYDNSKIIDLTIKNAVAHASEADRIAFVEALMSVVSGISDKTLTGLSLNKLNSLSKVVKGYESLSPENKKLINSAFKMLISDGVKNFTEIKSKENKRNAFLLPKNTATKDTSIDYEED